MCCACASRCRSRWPRRVRVGQPADVAVQATGEHFTGKVTRFTDALDRTTRTMQVEIDVPNDTYKLAAGNVCQRCAADPEPSRRADRSHPGGAAPGRQGAPCWSSISRIRWSHAKSRQAWKTPSRVEVLSGLNEGDRVIVGNFGAFQPGQVVAPKADEIYGSSDQQGGAE